MNCPECGTSVSAEVQSCPECGHAVASESGERGTAPNEGSGDRNGTSSHQQPAAGGDGQGRHGPTGTQRREQGLRNLPVVGGLVYGVVSYVVGLVLTVVLALGVITGETPADAYAIDAGPYGVGWLFYSVHNVGIVFDFGGETETVNFLEQAYAATVDPSIPKIAFYLVPVVVLFVFGLVLALQASYDSVPSGIDGAKAGASIAVGYLAMTILGAVVVFSVSPESAAQASGSIQPQLGSAVVLMGVLYPVAAGGLGGYLVAN